jgi:hypothetical protein
MLAPGTASDKPVAMAPTAPQFKNWRRPIPVVRAMEGGAQQAQGANVLGIVLKTLSDMGFTL